MLYNFKGEGERETDVGQISSKGKEGPENRPFKIQKFFNLQISKKWKGAQLCPKIIFGSLLQNNLFLSILSILRLIGVWDLGYKLSRLFCDSVNTESIMKGTN